MNLLKLLVHVTNTKKILFSETYPVVFDPLPLLLDLAFSGNQVLRSLAASQLKTAVELRKNFHDARLLEQNLAPPLASQSACYYV